jgi:hypothetical protein
MKTFLKICMLMVIMLLPATLLFAQDGTTPSDPSSLFESAFATFVGLVAAIPVVVEFFKNLFGKTKATPDWVVLTLSWVVGIIMTMVGWYFNLGFLSGLTWYWALIYGFGASLAANGVADTKIIQWIFTLFQKK